MTGVWSDKDKRAAAELNQLMRQLGAELAELVEGVAEAVVEDGIQRRFADLEIPEPGSDARGRLTFAFSCAMAEQLEVHLRRLEAARLEPAPLELEPATEATDPRICGNCGRKIVGHNGLDEHVPPCLSCSSREHAACQHAEVSDAAPAAEEAQSAGA